MALVDYEDEEGSERHGSSLGENADPKNSTVALGSGNEAAMFDTSHKYAGGGDAIKNDGGDSAWEGSLEPEDDDAPDEVVNPSAAPGSGGQNESFNSCDGNSMADEKVGSEDEEEDEDEAIHRKRVEEMVAAAGPPTVLDPKLCRVCTHAEWRYRCPACDVRTCSVECCRTHKEKWKCSGERQIFAKIAKLSHYTNAVSVQDAEFLSDVRSNLDSPKERTKGNARGGGSGGGHHAERITYPRGALDAYLVKACRMRKIFLTFSDDRDVLNEHSVHEQHSDTIRWSIDVAFVRARPKTQEDSKTSAENRENVEQSSSGDDPITIDATSEEIPEFEEVFSTRIHGVVDSIRVATILRHFLKPREHSVLISKADMNLEALEPFVAAGFTDVLVHMPIPNQANDEPKRWYLVYPDQDLLWNLRKRKIVDRPKLVISLSNETGTHFLSPDDDVRERNSMLPRQPPQMCPMVGGGPAPPQFQPYPYGPHPGAMMMMPSPMQNPYYMNPYGPPPAHYMPPPQNFQRGGGRGGGWRGGYNNRGGPPPKRARGGGRGGHRGGGRGGGGGGY